MKFDLILVRLDGSVVVSEKGVDAKDAAEVVKRWDATVEKAAILLWPSSVELPKSLSFSCD